MPPGISIGSFTITYYGIIIVFGAILGSLLASRLAKKHGQDSEIILDVLPWILIAGIIGARLWHVFTPSASNIAAGITTEYYFKNPLEILALRKGGLGIMGGVIGGVIAMLIYCKVKKLNFLQWADYIAPGLLVAQSIGRWGNFFNQEVYGRPSTLPWAIRIDLQHRMRGFEAVETYHPLFLYESLLSLIGAGILVLIGEKLKDKLYKGDLFLGYLVWYPTMRFFLEFLRLDPSPVNGININQTAMLIVAIVATLVLILRHTVFSKKLAEKEEKERELMDTKLGTTLQELNEEALADQIEIQFFEDVDDFDEVLDLDEEHQELIDGEETEDFVEIATLEDDVELLNGELNEIDENFDEDGSDEN
jgi:phosphatidylglycerol:prolipoprotein diacylglycerol transferase